MFLRLICFAALSLLISPQIPAAESTPGAPAGATSPTQPEYVLQPFDLIQVVVFQETDMERQVRLSQESTVTLPLIGTVNLKGMTIHDAQNRIRDLYARDYLVNPQINITVLEYSKETVTVLGSVNAAAAITIPPEQTLMLLDAIGRAGGFSRLADRKHVKLTRLTDDGKTSTVVINADQIIQSTSGDQWALRKGDVIYVPERIL